MKSEQVVGLFSYNNWANEKVLDFIGTLNHNDAKRNMSSSFGSIHETLIHILGAEEMWLSRWAGEEGRGLLNPKDFTDFRHVKDRWIMHESQLHGFLSSLTDNDMVKEVSYKSIKGVPYCLELWKQMLHVSNHSSYHRGQVVTMIRQLQLSPPSIDLIYYYLGKR